MRSRRREAKCRRTSSVECHEISRYDKLRSISMKKLAICKSKEMAGASDFRQNSRVRPAAVVFSIARHAPMRRSINRILLSHHRHGSKLGARRSRLDMHLCSWAFAAQSIRSSEATRSSSSSSIGRVIVYELLATLKVYHFGAQGVATRTGTSANSCQFEFSSPVHRTSQSFNCASTQDLGKICNSCKGEERHQLLTDAGCLCMNAYVKQILFGAEFGQLFNFP